LAAALRLALDHSISAYDAQFVVLAMALKVPLVTEDRRLRAAVHSVAVSVEEYLQLATE
jgi:predicted nucleic acid-binding protein